MVIFLILLLVLPVNLFNMPEIKGTVSTKKGHDDYPWKVHRIAGDFQLLDVWEFPILADKSKNQNFRFFLKVLQKKQGFHLKNLKNNLSPRFLVAGFLVVLRKFMGKIFCLDKEFNTLPIPGCKETSLRERLSKEDERGNLAEKETKGNKKGVGFRKVYLYENETLWEFSNNTVHALMHVGWVHKYENYYTAQLAVYAKTRGWLGDLYMKLIMPFRRHIIYPVLMNMVKSKWEAVVRK